MKYDISLVIPGLSFGPDTLATGSLGGSETAGVYMANALAVQGHRVTVFNNRNESAIDPNTRVNYIPIGLWQDQGRNVPHDVCIIQRAPELFAKRINSKLNYLWCHDLPDPNNLEAFKGVSWNIDRTFTLSEYMTEEYKKAYQLQQNEIFQTRNGVDYSLAAKISAIAAPARDRKKLMYCARPERGLDLLLAKIFPKLLEQDPELKLYIAGYDNVVEHMRDFYAYCDALANRLGDSVIRLGALTKEQLYTHYTTAGCYVYPTPSPTMAEFREVSCITAMECMACGLPFVSSSNGALPETLAHRAGKLVDGDPWSDTYVEDFVSAIIRYTRDDIYFNRASKEGKEAAEQLGWDVVAISWEGLFDADIDKHNNDPYRLAKHFWRQSDIIAAEKVIQANLDSNIHLKTLADTIDRDWPMIKNDDFEDLYEKIPEEVPRTAEFAKTMNGGGRYAVLKDYVTARPEIKSVLDYGCAYGAYTTGLAIDFPNLETTGIDIDINRVELATELAKLAEVDARVKYVHGDVVIKDLALEEKYDLVLLQEVLEHVKEPWAVAETVEKYAKPKGKVYVTVPIGPWEYDSYFTYPHRCHIWHFDLHDLYDMFGHKTKFEVSVLQHGKSSSLGDPLGWWIVTYDADQTPIGKIDMKRKLRLQRPRQTVSAILMGGPGAEEQMHWTLRSLRDMADEIILVDTGLSDEGRRIAQQYPLRIIAGVDPKLYGFETTRNMGLDEAAMDWVLWIDLDEKLVDAVNVHKYLRSNTFNGYGIRQHHFACDTQFKPDMPVRLFRNKTQSGKTMRFYGMIHEHPEFALNEGPGTVVVLADVDIAHTGYLSENIRQGRFVRNYPLLQHDIAKYPDRLLQKHFIMRDNILLCRYELRQNGMRVTPAIRQRCMETIKLGEKYFVGKGGAMSTDSLDYYTEALGILGDGFEVALNVTASRGRATPEPTSFLRFRSKEDCIAEITKRAQDAIAPLTRRR